MGLFKRNPTKRANRQNRRQERKDKRNDRKMERRQQKADNRLARAQSRQQTRITRQQMKNDAALQEAEISAMRDVAVAQEGFDPAQLEDTGNQTTGGRVASAIGGGIGSLFGGLFGRNNQSQDTDNSNQSPAPYTPFLNPPVETDGGSPKQAGFDAGGKIFGIPVSFLLIGVVAAGFMLMKQKQQPKKYSYGK